MSNSPSTTKVRQPGGLRAHIDARDAELRGKILTVVFLRKRGGLPVQADPDIVDHRRADLRRLADARVLITRAGGARAQQWILPTAIRRWMG